MLVKNSKIVEMHMVIGVIANRDYGPGHAKFRWGITKNQDMLTKAYEDIDKERKPKPEYAEEWAAYQKAREDTIQLYAATDETGKFLVDESRNEYILPQDRRPAYRDAIQPTLDKFADVIAQHNETLKEFNEILEIESDLNVHKIKVEMIPDPVLSSEMTALMPIWYDPDDEEASNIVELSKKTTKKKKKAN